MKAIVQARFGSPDVLELTDRPRPAVARDAVLVHVRAASVNAYDWHVMRGTPYFARLSVGFRRPKSERVGGDAAGIVEEVGDDVVDLRAGDSVFGSRAGSFADYVSGKTFIPMPSGLTFEQAAAIPGAGCTALQAVRDQGRVTAGQRVLITGAGGGVGTFAVQIARSLGAHVTAVTSKPKIQLVESLGVEQVLDRDGIERLRGGARFDVILDVAGNRSLRTLARLLAPHGRLVMVAPAPGDWAAPILRVVLANAWSRAESRTMSTFLARITRDDLRVLAQLVDAGKLRPVIDSSYPLADAAAAVRRAESGAACGKVVITI
ncbi:MAG: NAD(P)-dependent alcohol dehydrogenase [Chloroflexota bacterium]